MKKNKFEDHTFPDFQTCRVTVITTVWYWCKSIHIGHWNWIESLKILTIWISLSPIKLKHKGNIHTNVYNYIIYIYITSSPICHVDWKKKWHLPELVSYILHLCEVPMWAAHLLWKKTCILPLFSELLFKWQLGETGSLNRLKSR